MFSRPVDTFRTGDREREWRMRFGQWFGIDRDVGGGPVPPAEIAPVLGPRLEQDVDGLLHPSAALFTRHPVTVELQWAIAAAQANRQAAGAQDVYRGGFLGDAQRVVERDHVHGDAQVDLRSSRGAASVASSTLGADDRP